VPTGREEEWGPKFIPFQTIVRGNNNADTWFEMAALTIDLGNNSIPHPGAPHRMAGDQGAQRVPANADPDLLRGHITVQAPGEAVIGDRLPIRHLRYQIPHATLRHAAVGSERQVELPPAAGQVFPELPCDLVESLVGAGAERVRPGMYQWCVKYRPTTASAFRTTVRPPSRVARIVCWFMVSVPVIVAPSFGHSPLYLEDARGPAIVRSMPQWQKRIFTVLVRNSGSPAADFCLPAERTLSVATLIEI
jgi:hypothetical protein